LIAPKKKKDGRGEKKRKNGYPNEIGHLRNASQEPNNRSRKGSTLFLHQARKENRFFSSNSHPNDEKDKRFESY